MPSLSDVTVDYVSLVDRAAVRDSENPDQPMRFLLWKSANRSTQEDPMPDAKTPEELQAALTKAETENAELTSKLEAVKAKLAEHAPEETPQEIDKSELPEPVRLALEKAEEERAALAKRADDAEAIVKAERDERLTRDFITKAEGYKALPFKAAEFGPVLKACSEKLEKAEFDEVERVLKAADEQIAAGDLFKTQGRSGDAPGDDPVAEVQAKAAEIKKSDSSLSEGQALERALSSDSDLQTRYLNAVR